jgi:hypothetical protein
VTAPGTTIFSHLPERTLYLPRASDTTPPPCLSLGPYFPPAGTADTTAGLPSASAILFSLVVLFRALYLLYLAFSFLRQLLEEPALRPDETLTVQFAYPKEHDVDLIEKEVTDFDAVWSYVNSLPHVFGHTKAWEEIHKRDGKIIEREKELADRKNQDSDSESQDGDSESEDSDSESGDSDLQLQISALNRRLDTTQSELDAEKKQNKSLRLQQVSLNKRLNSSLEVSNKQAEKNDRDKKALQSELVEEKRKNVEETRKSDLDKTKLQSELDEEKRKNVTLIDLLTAKNNLSREETEKCDLAKKTLQSGLDEEKERNRKLRLEITSLNDRLIANKETHTDTSTSGSEETKETKKVAVQDPTQGPEEEKAPVALSLLLMTRKPSHSFRSLRRLLALLPWTMVHQKHPFPMRLSSVMGGPWSPPMRAIESLSVRLSVRMMVFLVPPTRTTHAALEHLA